MSLPRYFLPDHPTLQDIYTKEHLRELLVEGELSRSDIAVDDETGLGHLLGDLLSRAHPSPPPTAEELEQARQTYEVFSVDSPLPALERIEEDDEEDYEEASLEKPDVVASQSDEEEILHHLHPSWFSYPKTLLLFVLSAALAAWCYREQYGFVYVLVSASVAALCLLNISLDRSTKDYLITSKRVEAEFGIVGRNSKEVRICDIRAIDVHQEGYYGMVGVGTVDFCSAGGEAVDVQFQNIRNPHKFKKIVRALQN
jgi:hypothetical protein